MKKILPILLIFTFLISCSKNHDEGIIHSPLSLNTKMGSPERMVMADMSIPLSGNSSQLIERKIQHQQTNFDLKEKDMLEFNKQNLGGELQDIINESDDKKNAHKKLMDKEKHLGVVITCPLTHLMNDPWMSSMEQFGISCTKISGSVRNWREKLANCVSKLNLNHVEKMVIITTHDTSSKPDFVDAIEKIKVKKLLVADEVLVVASVPGTVTVYSYSYS